MNPRHRKPRHAAESGRAAEEREEQRGHADGASSGAEEFQSDAPALEEFEAREDPQDGSAPEAISAEIEQERAELDRAVEELRSLRDRHLRLAAEFDNYRKRTDRERAESGTRAQAKLVGQLLDPLDDLDRVAQLEPGSTREEALVEGVQLVRRKLMRALETAGLEEIDAEGQPFDPEWHEALMMVPTEERQEDETVASVFQKGYGFKGILLRPARVQVKRYGG